MTIVPQCAEQSVDRLVAAFGGAKTLHDPPAIGNRKFVGWKGFGWRGIDRTGIILGHRIRQRFLNAWTTATIDQGVIGCQSVKVHFQLIRVSGLL